MLKVSELFFSIQGEGHFTGLPAIFIRLAECNLKCSFCDTDFSIKKEMDEKELLEEIKKYNCDTIIITGGEPLLQDLDTLLKLLCTYNIHLETNGTQEIPLWWNSFDWVTCSPKNKIQDLKIEPWQVDEYKIITNEKTTIEEIEQIREQFPDSLIYLQPCWHKDNKKLTDLSISNTVNLVKDSQCQLSLQTQKLINIR